jgi:hypothetical protein
LTHFASQCLNNFEVDFASSFGLIYWNASDADVDGILLKKQQQTPTKVFYATTDSDQCFHPTSPADAMPLGAVTSIFVIVLVFCTDFKTFLGTPVISPPAKSITLS